MSAGADRELRDRLLRFLLRERAASLSGLEETYALPVAARVESGHAIAGVRPLRWTGDGRLVLHAPLNQSGFRQGEALRVGSGEQPFEEPEVQFVDYDPESEELLVEVPSYGGDRAAVERELARGGELVLDRSDFDMTDRLRAALNRVYDGRGAIETAVRDLLAGRSPRRVDAALEEDATRSLARLAERGFELSDSQQEAFVGAWAHDPYHLVQGPPGTGKTFLLGLLLAALAWRRERILVTAQTHLAVDNVLAALAKVRSAMLSVGAAPPLDIVRVTSREARSDALAAAGVTFARARGLRLTPGRGAVVGATLMSSLALLEQPPFTRVVFDEAAQVPLPHALCALLAAPRWLFFGDDRQLGPVVVGEHAEDAASAVSIFEHLRPSAEPTLLDRTYRMNDAVCDFPSRAFYGGRLRPARHAAERRFAPRAPDGAFAGVLDPERGSLLVRVDHEGYHLVCPPEVRCVADLAEEFLVRQGVPARDLAIVAPFRMQNREIQRALRRRLPAGAALPVIDTVERVQGQEREVVIVSLTCSDPDALRQSTAFFFSPNRLCVTLTRSRVKLVVVGSRHLLRTFPRDHEGLRRLDLFHRLFAELPQLNWTARYV